VILLTGTLLAYGCRTVAAALRDPGKEREPDFSTFHQVRNRECWSRRQLQYLIVETFVEAGGSLDLMIDETQERRWGSTISTRGYDRESVLESRTRSVSSPGLHWIVMAAVDTLPWSKQRNALPCVWVLAPTPEVNAHIGKWAHHMLSVVRHCFPTWPITLLGDTACSILERGMHLQAQQVTLLTSFHPDTTLHTLLQERDAHTIGRPRLVSQLLPLFEQILTDPTTTWQSLSVDWYELGERRREICTGTAPWGRAGFALWPIRWVFACDPAGKQRPQALFSTKRGVTARQMVRTFLKCWCLATVFEESQVHLGIEAQRQWSDLAIEQTTTLLFGLSSLVGLFGCALHPNEDIPFAQTAWYRTHTATFRDVVATVRRSFWGKFLLPHHPTILMWFSFLVGLSTALPGLSVTNEILYKSPCPCGIPSPIFRSMENDFSAYCGSTLLCDQSACFVGSVYDSKNEGIHMEEEKEVKHSFFVLLDGAIS